MSELKETIKEFKKINSLEDFNIYNISFINEDEKIILRVDEKELSKIRKYILEKHDIYVVKFTKDIIILYPYKDYLIPIEQQKQNNYGNDRTEVQEIPVEPPF